MIRATDNEEKRSFINSKTGRKIMHAALAGITFTAASFGSVPTNYLPKDGTSNSNKSASYPNRNADYERLLKAFGIRMLSNVAYADDRYDVNALNDMLLQAEMKWYSAYIAGNYSDLRAAEEDGKLLRSLGATVGKDSETEIDNMFSSEVQLINAKIMYWKGKILNNSNLISQAKSTADSIRRNGSLYFPEGYESPIERRYRTAYESNTIPSDLNMNPYEGWIKRIPSDNIGPTIDISSIPKSPHSHDDNSDNSGNNNYGNYNGDNSSDPNGDNAYNNTSPDNTYKEDDRQTAERNQYDYIVLQAQERWYNAFFQGDEAEMARAHDDAEQARSNGATIGIDESTEIDIKYYADYQIVKAKVAYWQWMTNGRPDLAELESKRADEIREKYSSTLTKDGYVPAEQKYYMEFINSSVYYNTNMNPDKMKAVKNNLYKLGLLDYSHIDGKYDGYAQDALNKFKNAYASGDKCFYVGDMLTPYHFNTIEKIASGNYNTDSENKNEVKSGTARFPSGVSFETVRNSELDWINPDGFIKLTPENASTKLSENFTLSEFYTDKDQSGNTYALTKPVYIKVDPELVRELQGFRDFLADRLGAKIQIEITSGFRSRKYNEALRKKDKNVAQNSQHMYGKAADINIRNLDSGVYISRDTIAKLADEYGFGGVGVYNYQYNIHVDVRDKKARWDYSSKGNFWIRTR